MFHHAADRVAHWIPFAVQRLLYRKGTNLAKFGKEQCFIKFLQNLLKFKNILPSFLFFA
jgi:hypothetical protein